MARKPKQKPVPPAKPQITKEPEFPITEEVAPASPELVDRMMHYQPPHCPECDACPVVCLHKRPNYAAYRCRVCDHRWEEGAR